MDQRVAIVHSLLTTGAQHSSMRALHLSRPAGNISSAIRIVTTALPVMRIHPLPGSTSSRLLPPHLQMTPGALFPPLSLPAEQYFLVPVNDRIDADNVSHSEGAS